MNPSDPVVEVMRRTLHNLTFIEQHATGDGPYEVTQLINSFLGALAHPWEHHRADLNRMSLEEATACGWPAVHKDRPDDQDPRSLGDLLRLVRNAFAHGNVTFVADARGEIRQVRICNKANNHRTWGATLTVADLRHFLFCFSALAETLHHAAHQETPDDADD